jgi:hypothetical protein
MEGPTYLFHALAGKMKNTYLPRVCHVELVVCPHLIEGILVMWESTSTFFHTNLVKIIERPEHLNTDICCKCEDFILNMECTRKQKYVDIIWENVAELWPEKKITNVNWFND